MLSTTTSERRLTATPWRIPKTIVFIDGLGGVAKAANYFREALLRSTQSCPRNGCQYTLNRSNKTFCVTDVVEEYTSTVAPYDRDTRYSEFKSLSSHIRIMVATTSLGMGVNVEDVERVVVWRFPIGFDLGDVWQRLGRGGRGRGRTSEGYIFIPYWVFDCEGIDRPGKEDESDVLVRRVRQSRNQLPADRARVQNKSRLQTSYSQDEIPYSDAESVASTVSAVSASNQESDHSGIKYWTKAECKLRRELDLAWKELANSTCYRIVFLVRLGEYQLPRGAERVVVEPRYCCNACNPQLFPPPL